MDAWTNTLEKFDSNKDARLSYDEFVALVAARREVGDDAEAAHEPVLDERAQQHEGHLVVQVLARDVM